MKLTDLCIVFGFSIVIVIIVHGALIIHDSWIDSVEDTKIREDYVYERYMSSSYSCDTLTEEIDSFDKYILRSPSDVLLKAFESRGC